MNILSLNPDFDKYFSQINFKFSLPQRKHLSTFVEGLLSSDGKKTLSNICENKVFPKDRSTFNKFLICSLWDEKELNKIRKIDSLNKMKEAMDDKIPCFFSIDDTILSKNSSSKKIEGLSFNYSHVSGKSEWSHCLVALHGHSNGLSLPLDFKPYLSKGYFVQQKDRVFKNKLELALDTLADVELQREKESYVLVDSWYTSEKFINESQKLGFQVIGGIKSNRIFYPDGIKNKLNEFSNEIDKETLDVVTVKGVEHHFYRYEGSIKGIERFWSLIYLIYNFLESERYKSVVKENLGAILDKIKIKNKIDFIGFIYDKFREGKSKQELLLNLGIPA